VSVPLTFGTEDAVEEDISEKEVKKIDLRKLLNV
jgi:hypothetical protein